MIALCILAWVLCGFAASYISYRWCHDSFYSLRVSSVAVFCLVGGFALLTVLAQLIGQARYWKFWQMVVFKGRNNG